MRRRAKAKKDSDKDPRDYVRALFQKSLNPHWPWWKVEVHAHEPHGKTRNQRNHTVVRKFAVGMPHFQAPGVAGRGTRGYVALPLRDDDTIADDADFVYLKDTWRVDHDGIDREGVTLQFLNDKGVKFVPTLVCHGDLPGQVMSTQVHWVAFHQDKDKVPLKRHQHYRLVVKEVGLPLEEFKDKSLELCDAIFNCLTAHAQAYKAGIIHRDISAGNMLLYKHEDGHWYGLLNDWKLSKKIDFSSSEGRQPDRTGTWQYMSAHALNDPYRQIVIQDELESFFHVLLYYAIRFFPHNLDDEHVGQFLHDYFDAYFPHTEGYRCGSAKFEAMRTGVIQIMSYRDTQDVANSNLKFLWPSPRKLPSLNPKPTDGSSSPALPSSPSPAERALPSADSPSSPVPRPPSPTSSDIYGSDLTSLPSDPVQPPQEPKDREHPLNTIIKQLLSWFQAHYALDSARMNTLPEGSQNNTQPTVAGPTGKRRELSEEFQAEDVLGGRDSSLDVAQTLQYERLRVKLQSHNAMLTLFYKLLNDREWPEHDKGRDKKPKGGYAPPKSAVPTTSTATGSKRRSMDEEPEARPGPSKRSRA
uniref:Filamentous fungal-specific transmembrane protein n=1 Tax=Ganoderma boninense TaxID=34458 RepID=A0A5K1K5I1_9APHY|nr:Filamentous fungal-specific transmembrane protein [Ganoderma boninense]